VYFFRISTEYADLKIGLWTETEPNVVARLLRERVQNDAALSRDKTQPMIVSASDPKRDCDKLIDVFAHQAPVSCFNSKPQRF